VEFFKTKFEIPFEKDLPKIKHELNMKIGSAVSLDHLQTKIAYQRAFGQGLISSIIILNLN
jgi:hypothetical protein